MKYRIFSQKKISGHFRLTKRGLSGLLALALLAILGLKGFSAEAASVLTGPDTVAQTYCVINGNTGQTLIEKDGDLQMYPASMTKVLTALIVLESVPDLSASLTFTASGVSVPEISSTLTPKAAAGEVMSVRDCLMGMLLVSGNECGNMLGEYVAGIRGKSFSDLMNEKALAIGCTGTHFVNAYGIYDADHYTTAHDMCLIMKAAMENTTFRALESQVEYTIPATNMAEARYLKNSNQMMQPDSELYMQGILAAKTGYTVEAGRCLVTAIERNGFYTISVIMHSTQADAYKDVDSLTEYVYGVHDGTMAVLNWSPANDLVTTTSAVNARYAPSTKSAVYCILEAGQTLTRVGTYGTWSLVEVNGGQYAVSSEFLVSQGPAPSKETTVSEETSSLDPSSESLEGSTETVSSEVTSKEQPDTSKASSPYPDPFERSSETEEETESISESLTETQSVSQAETEEESPAAGSQEQVHHLIFFIAAVVVIVGLVITWLIGFRKYRKGGR